MYSGTVDSEVPEGKSFLGNPLCTGEVEGWPLSDEREELRDLS